MRSGWVWVRAALLAGAALVAAAAVWGDPLLQTRLLVGLVVAAPVAVPAAVLVASLRASPRTPAGRAARRFGAWAGTAALGTTAAIVLGMAAAGWCYGCSATLFGPKLDGPTGAWAGAKWGLLFAVVAAGPAGVFGGAAGLVWGWAIRPRGDWDAYS